MTLFTQEDLLLYLYKESSPELTAAIEIALQEDWTLREKMQVIQSSVDQLDKAIVSPRMEVVIKIINYAREAVAEPVHHP